MPFANNNFKMKITNKLYRKQTLSETRAFAGKESGTPAKAGLFYVVTNIFTKAVSLLLSPVFTRILPPAEYGIYSLYLTWSGILTVAISLGISGAVIYRSLGKFREREDELIAAALSALGVVAVIFLMPALFFRKGISSITGLGGIINILLVSEAFLNAAESVLFAHKRYRYAYLEICVTNLLYAVLSQGSALLLIYLVGLGGEARIYSSFTVTAALIIPRLIAYSKSVRRIQLDTVKYLLKLSLPLLPNAIALTLIAQSDKIMIEHILGISELGKYSVAYSVGFMLTVITGALFAAIQPWLMRKLNLGRETLARDFTERLIWLSVLGLLIFTLFVPEIFGIIAAPEYKEAEMAVYPLAAAGLLQFISNILSANIIHTEKTGILSVFSSLALAINLLLNYAFIPTLGYLAAAFTTAVAYLALFLFEYAYIAKREHPRLIGKRGLSPFILLLFIAPISLMREFFASRLLFAAAIALSALPAAISAVRDYNLTKRHS